MEIIGDFGFRVVVEKQQEHAVEFKVYEIVLRDSETNEILQEDLYLTCTIKWDSCSHFWFGEEENGKQDGYLHICGVDAYKKHIQLMEFLYKKAFELMGREPLEGEEWD